MVKHIGCQWNEVEKKIICEREWYESYCRTHKEAKGLWDFNFPVHVVSQPSPTALNNDANETPVATKRNASPDIEDGVAKRSKTTPSPLDIGAPSAKDLPEKLRVSYVIKAFNANFESITNAVTNAATEDNARETMASEKLKEVIVEIMKLNLTNEDIFKAADMFAAERNRIDVFFGLPEELQAAYVSRLTGSSLTK
nr:hypothetical protein [Tanacetum cinerariifolium]